MSEAGSFFQRRGPSVPMVDCKHCSKHRLHKARGLCSGCFYQHRDKYPILKPRLRNTAVCFIVPDRFPEPTFHLPGTPEKIEVLCQRAASHQYLWNPFDAVHPKDEGRFLTPAESLETVDSCDDVPETESAAAD